jgi:iron complex outermembrane receptor protein
VRAMVYRGTRQVEQYLAIPAAVQADVRHAGGVVDLATRYHGGELRYSRGQLVAGISHDGLVQQRRGYENFVGSTLGVRGALRRDEENRVSASDQFVQLSTDPGRAWSVSGGLRHSHTRFRSRDAYVRAGNLDDSGRAGFEHTTPVMSVLWRAHADLHLYAAYGQGFETPTLVELAYRADGGAGPNLGLRAASSRNLEVGFKWRRSQLAALEAALFKANTRQELVVVSNVGGRAAYANTGPTIRRGLEISGTGTPTTRSRFQWSYTSLTATLANGARIPGLPGFQTYAAWHWQPASSWNTVLEGRLLGSMAANDANTANAARYASVDLSLGKRWQWSQYSLRTTLRLENLLDRDYVGSLIVNEANARFFEPAPGRTLAASFALDWR